MQSVRYPKQIQKKTSRKTSKIKKWKSRRSKKENNGKRRQDEEQLKRAGKGEETQAKCKDLIMHKLCVVDALYKTLHT